jgi:hypothetical protein
MRVSTRESDILAACLDLLRLRGILAWRNNTTGVYDPARKCFRAFHGLKGVSDILAILGDGRLLAVETKSATGRLTPEQEWFLDEVNHRGGLGLCVRSVGELDQQLAPILAQSPQDSRQRTPGPASGTGVTEDEGAAPAGHSATATGILADSDPPGTKAGNHR